MTIDQAFAFAARQHQAGRLDEAEAIYRQILARHPNHAESLHFLGVIARQRGEYTQSIDLIRKAIALKPEDSQSHSNLSVSLLESGQIDEAIAAARRAVELNSINALAHYNLGAALKRKGDFERAAAAFRQSIALRPKNPEAYNNLGNALRELGKPIEAITAYREAIAQRPNYFQAYTNLGIALTSDNKLDEAVESCRKAISINPDYAEAHFNLGNALRDRGDVDEAIAAFKKAIEINEKYSNAYSNLGIVLSNKGETTEALAAYQKGASADPTNPDAQWNLALSLLLKGDLEQGWEKYEWRWKCKKFSSPKLDVPQPQWNGEDLDGRTLLVYAEQGLGDTLQFLRYLPEAMKRGGKIVLECMPELKRLCQLNARGWQVLADGEPLPAFDLHCPIMSLARACWSRLRKVPLHEPPLHADPLQVEQWKQRIGSGTELKVGLVWAGNPTHNNDHNRSTALATFAPLAELPNIRWFSLQKGPSAAQAKTPPPGMQIVDWTEELNDYADTVALVANLDLVICVDTSMAHLTGCMAKPVWVLLPFAPDWRWSLEREDSDWYPTMRLFRQPKVGDWGSVMERVKRTLSLQRIGDM